jgi:hypothetical protein
MLFAQEVTPPDNPTATADQDSATQNSKNSKRPGHRKSATPNANPNVPTDSSAPPTAPKTPVRPADPTKPATNPSEQHQQPGVPKPPAS